MEKKAQTTKKAPKKANTTKKPVAKKAVSTKKATPAKKTVKKKEVVKKMENKEEVVKEPVVEEVKPVEEVKEESKPISFKKPNVSILTIILAISTIVLAIILLTSGPKSNIDLATTFPEVFSETPATMNMPKGFYFSDDSLEMFKKEGGLLKAKGMLTAAAYSAEEFEEMKTVFIEQYEAQEVEKEGYEVLTISQENGEDYYTYYFIYKDGLMLQTVLLNVSESEASTILNGVNF